MKTIEALGESPLATMNRHAEVVSVKWQTQTPPAHEFSAIACPEAEDDGGGFSVFALHYPGVVSQGETIEEAKENIAEAFLAMLESARKHGRGMEYSSAPVIDYRPACIRFRIAVDG